MVRGVGSVSPRVLLTKLGRTIAICDAVNRAIWAHDGDEVSASFFLGFHHHEKGFGDAVQKPG